jgi:hypothetical protein
MANLPNEITTNILATAIASLQQDVHTRNQAIATLRETVQILQHNVIGLQQTLVRQAQQYDNVVAEAAADRIQQRRLITQLRRRI